MQSTTHLNEWIQYTYQPQSVVYNCKDQSKVRTFVVPN
jgi:hypothetical protein